MSGSGRIQAPAGRQEADVHIVPGVARQVGRQDGEARGSDQPVAYQAAGSGAGPANAGPQAFCGSALGFRKSLAPRFDCFAPPLRGRGEGRSGAT